MKKGIKIIILIIFIISLLCGVYIYACYIIQKDAFAKIQINGQEILITKQSEIKEIDLQMLNSQYDTIVKIDLINAYLKINGKIFNSNGEINLGKINISDNNKIKLQVKFLGEFIYTDYFINTIPSDFPKYHVEGTSKQEGDYEYYITSYNALNSENRHYVYKITQEGQVTFYKLTNDVAYNFKKNIVDGEVRYTYLERNRRQYSGINSTPARLIVLDERYNEINQIGYIVEDTEIDVESHDYYYLGDSNYIVAGYTAERNTNLWSCRIQEVKDGKILWEFDSTRNEKLNSYYTAKIRKSNFKNEYNNYMYFNSMDIDPVDGNLICSFRNLNAIIKISRITGEIIWILGGEMDQFGLTDEQNFSKQHSAICLTDNRIAIYDNGEKNEITRIVILKLNEKEKKIEDYKSYKLETYSPKMGSVRVIDENENTYLITHGEGQHKCAFEEINLETMESDFKFILENDNILYAVNKFKCNN